MSFYDLGRNLARAYHKNILHTLKTYRLGGKPLIEQEDEIGAVSDLMIKSINFFERNTFWDELQGYATELFNYLDSKDKKEYEGTYIDEKEPLMRLGILDGLFIESVRNQEGCTSFVLCKKVAGGNVDLKSRALQYTILRSNHPPGFHKSLSVTLTPLIGSIAGVNEKSIGVFLNTLRPKNGLERDYKKILKDYGTIKDEDEKESFLRSHAGLPPSLVVQKILNEASSLNKAKEIAENTPCISGYNLLLFNKDKAIVVEKLSSKDGVACKCRESDNYIISTNHSIKKIPNAKTERDYTDSMHRYVTVDVIAKTLINYPLNNDLIGRVIGLLRSHFRHAGTGICGHDSGVITVASLIFNLTSSEYFYCYGSPCKNVYKRYRL